MGGCRTSPPAAPPLPPPALTPRTMMVTEFAYRGQPRLGLENSLLRPSPSLKAKPRASALLAECNNFTLWRSVVCGVSPLSIHSDYFADSACAQRATRRAVPGESGEPRGSLVLPAGRSKGRERERAEGASALAGDSPAGARAALAGAGLRAPSAGVESGRGTAIEWWESESPPSETAPGDRRAFKINSRAPRGSPCLASRTADESALFCHSYRSPRAGARELTRAASVLRDSASGTRRERHTRAVTWRTSS